MEKQLGNIMEYSKKLNKKSCDIRMSGRFTRKDLEKINDLLAYIQDNSIKNLRIVMQDLEFIDSSAIGQLLMIKEAVDKNKGDTTLSGASGHVKEMMAVSNFDQIFTIEE